MKISRTMVVNCNQPKYAQAHTAAQRAHRIFLCALDSTHGSCSKCHYQTEPTDTITLSNYSSQIITFSHLRAHGHCNQLNMLSQPLEH